MPFYERDDNIIKIYSKISNDRNFHYNRLLASFSKLEDEDMNSLLDIGTEEIEILKKCKSEKIEDPNLLIELKELNLFKILDCNERIKYIPRFDRLNNYHFYLGNIDEFLFNDYMKSLNDLELLCQEEIKSKKQKEPYVSKKQINIKKEQTEIKSKIKITKSKLKNNVSVENREFEEINYSQKTGDEEGLNLVNYQVKKILKTQEPQNNIPVSIANNKSHEDNILHYTDYVNSRHIFESKELSYHYNDNFFDTREYFISMRKNVNQQRSLNIIEYIAKQNHYNKIRTPNLAQFFITFHMLIDRNNCEKSYFDKDIYMSGAQLFKKNSDITFKIKNNIKLAYHDFLTS